MKNNIKTIILALSLVLVSCSKWLDVTPPSQIREEDQFSSVEGFQQALTGCYIGMTDDLLYGRALTWGTIELMAGQFEELQMSSNNDYSTSKYNYTTTNGQKYVNGVWSKAYNVIANANNALKYIDINKEKLDNINYSIIKGELLAIRAFMHFDLMRLYGYGNLSERGDISGKFAVPYVTTLSKDLTEQMSYPQTIAKMIADLEEAIKLLEIDPVTKLHPQGYYAEVNIDGFFNNRGQHLNYYSTALLLSRVYMWEGSSESIAKALTLSNKVAEETEQNGLVSWATSTSTASDPLMKSEHIFSLSTQNLFEKSANYFMLDINAAGDIYAQYVSNNRLLSIYETDGPGSTDFRFSRLFLQNNVTQDGTNSYTPVKYFGTASEKITKNYISLMRLPEAYYIAAECYLRQTTPDVQTALGILNTVRSKRGIIQELSGLSAEETMNELLKEYKKEFFCEGAMFFIYKRTGAQNIPGYLGETSDNIYVMPYPNTEKQMGRNQ
ncbi:MAG TPA: RagB/SusD family nutrient uptake outer membrane protein [Rikenellaceae bacterium]|nr:RagB/SusD family nutrient uptake outer membrane protein [Rikenellaceae bacterium]